LKLIKKEVEENSKNSFYKKMFPTIGGKMVKVKASVYLDNRRTIKNPSDCLESSLLLDGDGDVVFFLNKDEIIILEDILSNNGKVIKKHQKRWWQIGWLVPPPFVTYEIRG